jgi:tetratricopeptide (TPR) repeat protein
MKSCCKNVPVLVKPTLTLDQKLEMRRSAERLGRAGKHLEACEILLQLLEVSPRNPLIWNDLGVQYEAAGEIDNALEALRRGYICDSTYPPILYNLGKFTIDRLILQLHEDLSSPETLQMWRKAVTFLNANLDRDPANADAHYYLALAFALAKDMRKAQVHMDVALRMKAELAPPSGWLIGLGGTD